MSELTLKQILIDVAIENSMDIKMKDIKEIVKAVEEWLTKKEVKDD